MFIDETEDTFHLELIATELAYKHAVGNAVYGRWLGGKLHNVVLATSAPKGFVHIVSMLEIAQENTLLHQHLTKHPTPTSPDAILAGFADSPLADIADETIEYCIKRSKDTQPRLEYP